MWNGNSNTDGLPPNWQTIPRTPYQHTATIPCHCAGCHASFYAFNPTAQCYNTTLPNLANFLTYQGAPQTTISGFSHLNDPVYPLSHVENDQVANEQNQQITEIQKDEIDSWLLLNPDHDEDQGNNLSSHGTNGCLNLKNYNPWTEIQYQGQCEQLQPYGIQQVNHNGKDGKIPVQFSREALMVQQQEFKFYSGTEHEVPRAASSYSPSNFPSGCFPSTEAEIAPQATVGSTSNTEGVPPEWEFHRYSLPFVHPDKIPAATIGSHSNSKTISSEGKSKLLPRAASKKPSKFPPMTRQERVLRYLEKRKTRKFEKKIQYSSRKTYAQTRPRIRGRFTRSSQKEAQ